MFEQELGESTHRNIFQSFGHFTNKKLFHLWIQGKNQCPELVYLPNVGTIIKQAEIPISGNRTKNHIYKDL